MNRSPIRLSLLALALAAAPALVAQESSGAIVGTVKDKSGNVLAGAEIRLTSPALQGTRSLRSDEGGGFRAPLLPPGAYTILVVKEGFVAPKSTLQVGLGQTVRTELIMASVKAAESTVEVIATAASVDKSDAKSSTNITSEFMDLIPRTTRGMDTVALLAPGVTVNNALGGRVQIRGGQTTQNRFLLNGTDIADNVFGNTNGRQYYVDDSVSETQVIQSPVNPRYGNFTGGIINAITRTGSNEFSFIFRANLSRNAWSATSPLGPFQPGTGQSRGNVGVGVLEDGLNRSYSLWLGGPIVKDRLWFALSTKLDPSAYTPQNFNTITGLNTGDTQRPANPPNPASIPPGPGFGTGPGESGGPFTRTDSPKFYELKLTFAINANHTLELAGNKSELPQVNRFYVNTIDPNTLVPQTNDNEYRTLSYKGVIGNNLTIEARYSYKHQLLSAGGDPAKGDPIRARYSNGVYYIFQNGIFDKTDGGDNRNIDTWTMHVQWFSPKTSWGTHILEGGFELLNQDRQAANAQSPTGRQFFVWGRNADGTYRAAGKAEGVIGNFDYGKNAFDLNFVGLYIVDKGTANTKTSSYYVSDTWSLNDHWQLLLGGRYDKVESSDTLGSTTISSNRFSPRVQLTHDLKGDQSWITRLSFARYVGKLNDSFTNLFTLAGNPITEFFGWRGSRNDSLTYAEATNLNNWEVSAAGFQGQTGPKSRTVDPSTKAPYVDEWSLGGRHTWNDGSFLAMTFTTRKWKGFFNDFLRIGGEMEIPLRYIPGTQDVVEGHWGTDDSLTRDYKSFEIEFSNRLSSRWTFAGNYTYAILRGNGEGSEGNNPSVAGDPINNYASVHETRGRDLSYYAPDGYLTGDQRHRARFHLDYLNRTSAGAVYTASVLFNYDGGGNYSLTRGLSFEAPTDAAATPGANPDLYPSSYTRFYGPRGLGRFNDTFNFDLKVGADVPLWSKLRFFAEVTVFNVFNHWQLATYSTLNGTGTTLLTSDPNAGYNATGRTSTSGNNTGFGTYGNGSYVGGRSVVLSTGFKW